MGYAVVGGRWRRHSQGRRRGSPGGQFLLRARLPDSTEQVHVAVEVSRTVGNDDITRARERADLLAAAAGTQGRAVVIGTIIPEPQRERAAALGVALFQEGD